VERIGDGFSLAEAPVVTADDVLLVSDVLGGGVRRFAARGRELDPLLDRRRGIGGMAQLPDGSVVVSGRDLSVVDSHGTLTVVAEVVDGGTGYNDLTTTADGLIVAGMLTCHPMSDAELTPGVIVEVRPDADVVSAPLPFDWPNGVGFSPSEDTLYLADYATGVVHRGAWSGSVSDLALEPWITTPSGDADGLAVAPDGSLWVASGGGRSVLHYSSTGHLLEAVEVPDDFVSSCCLWPGTGRLVITTGTGVFLHEL
jgi:sugar lactone lactonase YvrE